MKITITLNNKPKKIDIPPNRTLMDLLRGLGLWSVKHGCEKGDCGNCTVIVDGKAVYSCIMLAAQVNGKSVETFEGISNHPNLDELIKVIMDFGDIECGYCNSGFILSLKALLEKNPDPDENDIAEALTGIKCRCTKKPLPIEAIKEAINKMNGNW